MSFIAIIPARYGSSRFPGKPLADLGGNTVIERVYRQVSKALDDVWVATDDERIFHAVEAFGGRAVMTSTEHRSGTDRCREAYHNIQSQADVIINVQGDEPFIDPEQLRQIMACFDSPEVQIATLVRPFDAERGYEALENPNTPKVTLTAEGYAMLFSRSVIPYCRGVERSLWPQTTQYYTHIGMYAYRAEALEQITQLKPSPLELAESLEQLRWLQNGYRIRCGISTCPTVGIDTPADLEAARRILQNQQQ